MSYSINIGDKEEYSITYNLSKMLYDFNKERGIRVIYGKSGEDVLPILLELHKHLLLNYDRLVLLNPLNGWGNIDELIRCVSDMATQSATYKNEIWDGD